MSTAETTKITVTPDEFHLVRYDADEIRATVADVADLLGVSNPITLIIDESTPLAKLSAEVESSSSDATIVVRAESGALENNKQLTTFGPDHARESIGRMLLRARDRMRPDFADVPADVDLSHAQNAAWDAYCTGRLAALGERINQQRWRYNYRNRFGFSDAADADFDRLWSADDLAWSGVLSEGM